MDGIAYGVVALLFAMAAVASAHHLRVGEPPSAATEAATAVIAGVLWPVMAIGLAQLWALHRLAAPTDVHEALGFADALRIQDVSAEHHLG